MPEDRAGAAHAAPIIIKRIKKAEHGHHGGAWKVAYADMVTALMALFIVLWILNQSEEVIQAVAGYFRDPSGYTEGGHAVLLDGGTQSGQPSLTDSASSVSHTAPVDLDPDSRWRERAGAIHSVIDGSAAEAFENQIEMTLTPDGLRVSLVESHDNPIFRSGSLEMHPAAREMLLVIGREIARLAQPLSIEGHTDSSKFATTISRSNWDLSTGRAHTARRVLVEAGVDESRIFEIRGYADRVAYNPLDSSDSRNRRIAITLLSEEAHLKRFEQTGDTVLADELTE